MFETVFTTQHSPIARTWKTARVTHMTKAADTATLPLIRTVGLAGILVTFGHAMSDPANRGAIAFRAHVDALEWPEISESMSSLVSAFFRIDLVKHDPASLIRRLEQTLDGTDWLQAPLPQGRKRWTVPAVFGGDRAPQLQEAADVAGMSVEDALHGLTQTTVRVLTVGFAPGQPYLGTLPENWNIPRLTCVTPNVPACSLVAAIRQLCLFPYATPTGWRHVGQTAFHPFQLHRDTPFALTPGDEMRFVQISDTELRDIEAFNETGLGGATWDAIP